MPFGLAPAPRLATKMMAPIIQYLCAHGLWLAVYIDDLILPARSHKESIKQTQLLVDTQAQVRHSSSQMPSNPLPIKKILGHTIEQRKIQFRLPKVKIRSTHQEIRSVFSDNDNGTLIVQKLCSFLSKLNSLSKAAISAQLHLWPLHHLMRQQLAHATYKDGTHLNLHVIEQMQWCHDQMHRWPSKAIILA